jgi:transcriptional regulator with XRE-family HTH domain
MSSDDRSFGGRLRATRISAGLSQEELAERSGLSLRAIGDLERGRTRWPYRDSVHRLADALGLRDPARAEFIAAARRRLIPDTDPAVNPGAPAAAVQQLPRQLPTPPQLFTGRVTELADLGKVHDASTVVITAIDGMAGVGKTALAVQAAHQMVERYPDGQLFIDLHGYTIGVAPTEPGEALDRMLRALGVPGERIPAGLDDRGGLYRSRLADQRVVIVLDNAATESQLRRCCPAHPAAWCWSRACPGRELGHAPLDGMKGRGLRSS